jgi:hypothetical protein
MIEFTVDEDDTGTVMLIPSDQGFSFYQGPIRYSRASMRISPDCPDHVRDLILEAQYRKWLEPVVYMKQEEWAWARMAGDS